MDNEDDPQAKPRWDLHPEDVLSAVHGQPPQIQDAILWQAAALTERRKTEELERRLASFEQGGGASDEPGLDDEPATP